MQYIYKGSERMNKVNFMTPALIRHMEYENIHLCSLYLSILYPQGRNKQQKQYLQHLPLSSLPVDTWRVRPKNKAYCQIYLKVCFA